MAEKSDWASIFEDGDDKKRPTLGINYMDAALERRTISLNNQRAIEGAHGVTNIEIHQDLSLGLGACLWDCVRTFLHYMRYTIS